MRSWATSARCHPQTRITNSVASGVNPCPGPGVIVKMATRIPLQGCWTYRMMISYASLSACPSALLRIPYWGAMVMHNLGTHGLQNRLVGCNTRIDMWTLHSLVQAFVHVVTLTSPLSICLSMYFMCANFKGGLYVNGKLHLFSPPVQFAGWAPMRRFLSVCLSVCLCKKFRLDNNSYLDK